MDVNYKKQKSYNLAHYPIRQPIYLSFLIWLLCKIILIGKKYKIEKINMEGLKGPYFMLSNHMYFIDFELAAMVTGPKRINNIVSIDGYYRRPWLMEWIGAIGTRKYTKDLHMIKSISKVLKRGDILSLYPEARYSPCGIPSFIPESLGKLIKKSGVPVVTIIHHGNHLHSPFWNFRKKRKVPMHTVATQLLTAEQVKEMSWQEIHAAIVKAFEYDDYQYQKDNNIKITEPYRTEGLHKVLYQCPHCKKESQMDSKGAELFCKACGKRWIWKEDGNLEALEGKTEFSHIPDWFLWQKEQVRTQIEEGTYSFEDEVEVYSFPNCKFIPLGKAKVRHDMEEGFIIEGTYRGEPYRIQRKPIENHSLHIEYDYCYIKPEDCFDLSTEKDSFYCYPTKQNVITKLAFATEILYERQRNK